MGNLCWPLNRTCTMQISTASNFHAWMAIGLPLLLVCVDARGRVRLDDLTVPHNVDEALDLHDVLMQRSRNVRSGVAAAAGASPLASTSVISGPKATRRACSSHLPRGSRYQSKTIISPTDFGADPTGRKDSTLGIQQAVSALLKQCDGSERARHYMAKGIADCGGVVMDLSGGEFLISEPIVIPPGVGNININGGT